MKILFQKKKKKNVHVSSFFYLKNKSNEIKKLGHNVFLLHVI